MKLGTYRRATVVMHCANLQFNYIAVELHSSAMYIGSGKEKGGDRYVANISSSFHIVLHVGCEKSKINSSLENLQGLLETFTMMTHISSMLYTLDPLICFYRNVYFSKTSNLQYRDSSVVQVVGSFQKHCFLLTAERSKDGTIIIF